MSKKRVLLNPVGKAINVWDDDDTPEAWEGLNHRELTNDFARAKHFYGDVPWFWGAVNLIASACATQPFVVVNASGEEVDNSADYTNVIGWLPDPEKLITLIVQSRQSVGRAYIWNERNQFLTLGVRYLRPDSIEPIYNDLGELIGWYRLMLKGGQVIKRRVEFEDVIHFWMTDPFVEENEVPEFWPGKAALRAAGVLDNIDLFSESYFGRGAIKATILAVPKGTARPVMDALKSYFKRVVTGIKNAFTSNVFQAGEITPTIIGDGVDSLTDGGLSETKREDVARAFNIPQTIFDSSIAGGIGGGGVTGNDTVNFILNAVLPELREVFAIFNAMLEPQGLRIKVNKQAIDALQEDEKERSFALTNVASAVSRDPVAAEFGMSVLGFELSDEQRASLDEIIANKEEQRELQREQFNQRAQQFGGGNNTAPAQPEPVPSKEPGTKAVSVQVPTPAEVIAQFKTANSELSKWQRFSVRVGGKRGAVEFEPEELNDKLAQYISDGINELTDNAAIKAVYASARKMLENSTAPTRAAKFAETHQDEWENYP